ncbi:nucleoid-associated protein [Desulfoferrobacter suflitae]|uniref:nucleoid-associated protein n=1 Tax=Desulfoferrobacter suflitae TaxID=2865782 RepID=UPI002164BB40|nr:nucleoid-associated protein [Desulfoferrobacter suflitae]MCK8600143.1 nucleoid-associated protein [Desulfoferrobacter suflitae]
MMTFLEGFSIQRVVLHKVFPRRDKTPVPPRYGDRLIELHEEGLMTLEERVVKALGHGSHGMEMSIDQVGARSFFDLGTQLLDDDDEAFVERSRTIADKLNEAQATRDLPGGALAVMNGLTGPTRQRFIMALKAELHDGFDLRESRQELTLAYLASLMLTPAQRFHKIGMLLETRYGKVGNNGRSAKDFMAFLYDHKMTATETRPAAQYFHRTLLGFELSPSGKKLTQDFYEHTRRFISGSNLDPEAKLDIFDALYTTLKVDQAPALSVVGFAQSYLSGDEDLYDDYVTFMREKGLPTNAFAKDTTYLKGKLKRRQVRFSSDVLLSAPADRFSELVRIEGRDDLSTLLRVQGTLKAQE